MIKGAEALLRVFREENVDVFFGYPGGAVIPIYDSLYDAEDIRGILPRHEQGAAHAADGYARVTGKVGVCMATSGPGACNLVTGLATAYMDSVPMVAITGQVKTHLVGTDSFQEADTTGITIPITKHNYLVKDPHEIERFPDILREAFYLARTGRPGPVLVDIPFDVSAGDVPWAERNIEALDGYEEPKVPADADIDRAADMIESAQRPVIMIGGGVIHAEAHEEILELAEKTNIYVVHTLMAKGCMPESHELSMGMPGMHGMTYASYAIQHSDLMIVIGARFDDRITGDLERFAPDASVIHIDIDPAEIDKVRPAAVGIAADAKIATRELIQAVSAREPGEWEEHLRQFRADHPLGYEDEDELMAPQLVVEKLYEVTGGQAIVTTEVGQNQMWAAHYYPLEEPRRWCTSGGLGTMGYGHPAAIGAQVGRPDEIVVDVAGDGSIQMCMQELTTGVINRLPLKIIILNNSYLGMVRQWQDMFFDRRYSGVDLTGNPDFVRLAEAHGAVGLRCKDRDRVVETLEQAMEVDDRPVMVDFAVAKEENVLPFIPAGKSWEDLIECPTCDRE
ncbi:MAG: biosynthetic-type acetolactate synthase large subunit [Armatimonadota bacterium]